MSGSWPMLLEVGEGRFVCPFETLSGPEDPRPTKVGQVRFTLQHRPVSLQSLAFPGSKKSLTHTLWVPPNTACSVAAAERASRRQRHLTGVEAEHCRGVAKDGEHSIYLLAVAFQALSE